MKAFDILTMGGKKKGGGGDTIVGQDGLTYGIIKAKDGRFWLDRNLGATRVATAQNDSQAFGDLYQWGRLLDGHEKRTSGTTTTLSSTDNPGHSAFILKSSSPRDWRSPKNNDLWQGVNGINNVCPVGFRLPTINEWANLFTAEAIGGINPGFLTTLKLPNGGYRSHSDGTIARLNTYGYYWSSVVTGDYSYFLYLSPGSKDTTQSDYRAKGFSVRCIKDES